MPEPTVIGPADPLTLARGPQWRNRTMLAPLTNKQSGPDGVLGDDELAWLVRRAEGGFGMVMTCAAFVSAEGHTFDGQLGASGPQHLPGLTRLAGALRTAGTVSSVQLQHGGRRADGVLGPVVGPWDDAAKGAVGLTTSGVERVVREFADAARLVQDAGFDGAEVHAAHGYLLGQFLSARDNTRTDRYGGSAEARFRVVHDVIDAIRGATGPDFQLGVRLSPERYGIPLAEGRELARQLLSDGRIDYLDMSMWDTFMAPHDPEFQGRPLLDYFTELPRGTTRLGVAGKILTAAQVRECLDRGADFVAVGTAGILHHDFARRVIAEDEFVSATHPVSAAHLTAESVGPAFLHYLSTNWDDFVTAD